MALISEHQVVAFLGIEAPFYEFANRHHLPCVNIAAQALRQSRVIFRSGTRRW